MRDCAIPLLAVLNSDAGPEEAVALVELGRPEVGATGRSKESR